MRRLLALLLVGLAQVARAEEAAPPVRADPVAPEAPARQPYLAPGALDTIAVLAPPPQAGTEAEAADRLTFARTRALKGTPRWALATADVAGGARALLADFSCALGTSLDSTQLPVTTALLERARLDVAAAVEAPKEHYRRTRPHVGNGLPVCVARSERLARSASYPSGHATEGWTFALILASAAPAQATGILRRGRIYGESRLVCGVHWRSDVEAGRTAGAALYAALVASAPFRADLDRARAELAAVLARPAQPPEEATCAREAGAAAEPLP
ncbi:Acid phosphatase [Methylobacterium sp. 4-46]|uniref:acid phosphatase n=1 Tax=unclassified Methylobacterium TaxID=2615210 RepID=UPI000152E5ED|nr:MULTISPECIES: phosphatase PAP2 family protein [Methylobacterium]ACA16990.1 Acid phosphatase [Methylobacterium sp. 4-46]WFT82679.1 phosphatase PAP2 family protein [Methylobacterium nodulans]